MASNPRGRSPIFMVPSSRRRVLLQGGALASSILGTPWVSKFAAAQGAPDLGPYLQAKINWRQTEGEQITVAVIPASYFDNLIALGPQFEALTGIKVRFEKVPPGQIRQKALLDLGSKTATYATHAADVMYYSLYAANKLVEPLDRYLNDPALTDAAWFNYTDILKAWRDADSVDGKPYGIPYDGEVTVQVYRKDLYAAKGLKPADTLTDYVQNAQALHDPGNRMYGMALRGFAGAGQNVYIWSSIFREFGGQWFTASKIKVNTAEANSALNWYVDSMTKLAPPAAKNWNWPDIADAFSQGTLASYVDAHSSAAVLNNVEKSKVIGKIGFARWPKGPTGKRCTSIWNWGFPINSALTERQKKATWLFISWAASAETQARTSWKSTSASPRSGINRLSLWRSTEFNGAMKGAGDNFVEASLASLEGDTDVEWRPRLPQWPSIGETMGTAIQAALVGQKKAGEALDEAQARIEQAMKS